MAKTMKTAITIPKEVYDDIEKIRKETGKSRSAILVEGFVYAEAVKESKEWEALYEAVYKRHPETEAEIKQAGRMSTAEKAAWPEEDW